MKNIAPRPASSVSGSASGTLPSGSLGRSLRTGGTGQLIDDAEMNVAVAPNSAASDVAAIPEALPPGTSLRGGTILVERVLRREGFCLSYAAHIAGLGQAVALQELFPPGCVRRGSQVVPDRLSPAQFESFRQRFGEEARALKGFYHPNAASARLTLDENGTTYLVTDWVAGSTLQERIDRDGALPEAEAVGITSAIGEALAAMHAIGLAHGDVRPANVTLPLSQGAASPGATSSGAARGAVISDWGLDRWLERDYVSGDQAAPPVSTDGDVYALGALLFLALTGQKSAALSETERIAALVAPTPKLRPRGCGSPVSAAVAEVTLWAFEGVFGPRLPRFLARLETAALHDTDAHSRTKSGVPKLATALGAPSKLTTPKRATTDTPFDAMIPDNAAAPSAVSARATAPTSALSQAAGVMGRRIENRWLHGSLAGLGVSAGLVIALALGTVMLRSRSNTAPTAMPITSAPASAGIKATQGSAAPQISTETVTEEPQDALMPSASLPTARPADVAPSSGRTPARPEIEPQAVTNHAPIRSSEPSSTGQGSSVEPRSVEPARSVRQSVAVEDGARRNRVRRTRANRETVRAENSQTPEDRTSTRTRRMARTDFVAADESNRRERGLADASPDSSESVTQSGTQSVRERRRARRRALRRDRVASETRRLNRSARVAQRVERVENRTSRTTVRRSRQLPAEAGLPPVEAGCRRAIRYPQFANPKRDRRTWCESP